LTRCATDPSGYGLRNSLACARHQCALDLDPIAPLLTWPGAVVVVDPKGEQWQRTASWRASNIGPVYCLPPAGIDLLDYFDLADPLDTQELHQHLIRPWQDKDPVFAEKCLALFTAAAQVGTATDSHALRVLAEWTDQRAPIALQAAYPHARAAIDRFVDGDDPARPNRFALTAWGIFSSRVDQHVPHPHETSVLLKIVIPLLDRRLDAAVPQRQRGPALVRHRCPLRRPLFPGLGLEQQARYILNLCRRHGTPNHVG